MEFEPKNTDIVRLFNALPALEPSRALFEAIFLSYELHRRKMARVRLSLFIATACASLGGIIPAALFSIKEFSQSGFTEYASLMFSDTRTLLPYAKEFGLSLIESLPILAIAIVFLSLFIFLASIKIAGKNYKTAVMQIGHAA